MASFFRSLFGGDHLWELVEQQAGVVHRGALAISAEATPDSALAAAVGAEVEGERLAHEIEAALRSTFFVPINREDLHELSNSLGDVLALTAHSQRASAMPGSERPPTAGIRLEELLVRCTETIRSAIAHMKRGEYDRVVDASRELREIQKTADVAHDEALSSLLRADDSLEAALLIRRKAPLDDLAETVGQCGAVGKLLAYLAVKNA